MNDIAPHPLHGRSDGVGCSFPVAPVSSGAGDDRLDGGIVQSVHNFSNERSDAHRIVLVDINRSGIARLFHFIPSFHEVQNDAR